MCRTVRGTQRRVQRHFSRVRQREIYICAVFDEELTKPPMPMKSCTVEVEIFSKRRECFAVRKQKFYRADIAVIRAPFDERHAICISSVRGIACCHVIKTKSVRPFTIRSNIDYVPFCDSLCDARRISSSCDISSLCVAIHH